MLFERRIVTHETKLLYISIVFVNYVMHFTGHYCKIADMISYI